MGNQPMEGIPPLLSKNWQPVPNHPNTFRNRLTHEYAHKHIVKVEEPIEIQSFKYRMHENNQYLCRVLYYHEYTDSIYHVYTDEMHIQPQKRHFNRWAQEKVKIMETFRNLSELFGYTRVCRQMIGSDTNGHIKIWIHPDPISSKIWSPCPTESLMVSDIQNILFSIEQVTHSKPLNRSYDIRHKTCSSFQQFIREGNKNILKGDKIKKGHNISAANFNNSTTNVNININIELDSKGRPIVKNQPHTHPDSLQKAFNPVICETKRKEEEDIVDYSDIDKNNSLNKIQVKPNRPSTDYPFHKPEKTINYRTENNTKRRDSDFFKYPHMNQKNPKIMQGKNSSAYPSVGKKYGESPSSTKHIEKNILGKLLNTNIKFSAPKTPNHKTNYLKKPSGESELTFVNDRPSSNFNATYRPTAKSKNTTIPNFLAQRAVQGGQMKFRTCISLEKYPQPSDRTEKNEIGHQQINLSPIKNQSRRQFYGNQKDDDANSAIATMKDELNNILDTPVIREPVVSESFENFKAGRALYKPCPSREQDTEMEQIKEKVQKKKATFAHLKLEAMKILQDDF